MCCSTKEGGCQCPEELQGKIEECTPEQIEKCHGTSGGHPCTPEKEKNSPGSESPAISAKPGKPQRGGRWVAPLFYTTPPGRVLKMPKSLIARMGEQEIFDAAHKPAL